MRINKNLIMLLVLTILFSCALFSQQKGETQEPKQEKKEEEKAVDVDFSVGLNLAYTRAPVKLDDSDAANSLEYTYLALQIDADLFDFLTLGVVAGYNSNSLRDIVDFSQLPLSLRGDGTRFNSMMFGIRARADLYSWEDFSFAPECEILLFKKFKKELDIQLPIASGTAALKNSFTQIALDLLVRYDGFSNFTIFAGPQMNLISGTISASETIEGLEGEQSLGYSQKKTFGFTAGIYYELGGHLDIGAKLSLLAKTSLSVTLYYIF